MTFEYRSAEGRQERLQPLATELVRAKPDVLIAGFGTLAAQAAKAATTSIPIVALASRRSGDRVRCHRG
jgi:putative ABC transport system substrate-binding protein